MKKMINKINFAIIGMMLSVPAMAAADADGLCGLIEKLQGVFKVLRILAFVGAGFFIATWAWDYITGSDKAKDSPTLIKDLKTRGTAMLVGFLLLFIIGVVLSAAVSVANGGSIAGLRCGTQLVSGWN